MERPQVTVVDPTAPAAPSLVASPKPRTHPRHRGPATLGAAVLLGGLVLLAQRPAPLQVELRLVPAGRADVAVRNDGQTPVVVVAARLGSATAPGLPLVLLPGSVLPVTAPACPSGLPTALLLTVKAEGRSGDRALPLKGVDRQLRERCDFYAPRASVGGHVITYAVRGRDVRVTLELWNQSALRRSVAVSTRDLRNGFVAEHGAVTVLPPSRPAGEHLHGRAVQVRVVLGSTGCTPATPRGQLPLDVTDEAGAVTGAVVVPSGLLEAEQAGLAAVCR